MKLIQAEWYRMLHGRYRWGITIALVIVSYWLVHQEHMQYFSGEQILQTLLMNPIPVMWSGVIVAAECVGSNYESRNWNGAVYLGYSRTKIVLMKAVVYYLWAALIQICSFFAVVTRYQAWDRLLELDEEILVAGLGVHLLCCIAIWTVPFVLAYVCRNLFLGMAISGGIAFLCQTLIGDATGNKLAEWIQKGYPAGRMISYEWCGRFEIEKAWELLCLCGGYLVIGLGVAVVVFRKQELK